MSVILACGVPALVLMLFCHWIYDFWAFVQENSRILLNVRAVTTAKSKNIRDEIFTICELLSQAYLKSVAPRNILSGFKRTDACNYEMLVPNNSQIKHKYFKG